ncbi:MAG TPA: phosphatase PAP2 family protein [Anaerolineae bacterium]|nr:phosphatase PAP2 family protein [Anaerolineae bacterium]
MTMAQELAQFIGMHAIELLLILLVVVLLTIVLLWRWFEAYHRKLWKMVSASWRIMASLSFVQRLQRQYPRAWSFGGARLSPTNYLGLHLTLGLLLSLAALNIFAGLADEVMEQEELTQFDLALATALHQNATPGQVAVFKEITKLGNVSVIVALGLGVSLVLLIRRCWLLLAAWLITLAGGVLLNLVLKAIFQRVRPEFANPFVNESGWSCPSGHAMISLITYGMAAYLLMLALSKPLKQVVVVVTVILVLLIGFSRLYLGAHYFSDVLAGYAAGALWLAVTISGTEVARRRQREGVRSLSSAAEVELNPPPSLIRPDRS